MPKGTQPKRLLTPSNSLERALAILERIADRPGGLTNKQISEDLKIATSSCSYILTRLEGQGYLSRDAGTGRYEIGLKVLAIARGALRKINFAKLAEPVLRRLSNETGLESLICVLDQERLLVVSRVRTDDFGSDDVGTGSEFPAHAMATGKVLLAHLPPEEAAGLVRGKELVKFTPNTIVSREALFADLELVRTRGYAISDEEYQVGMFSVGVPIVDSGRGVRAALAAVGSTKQPAWKEMPSLLTAVKAAAREISRSFGSMTIAPIGRRLAP